MKSAKTSLCDGIGVHQCPQHGWSAYVWKYHWCGGSCWNFGETYAAVKTTTFPRKFISANNARPHSAGVIGIEWLHRHRVCVPDWPAYSADQSPIENVCHIMKRRIRQRRPRTVQQLKSCIHREWAKFLLAKLQPLISIVPKRLQSVIKIKGDITQW